MIMPIAIPTTNVRIMINLFFPFMVEFLSTLLFNCIESLSNETFDFRGDDTKIGQGTQVLPAGFKEGALSIQDI